MDKPNAKKGIHDEEEFIYIEYTFFVELSAKRGFISRIQVKEHRICIPNFYLIGIYSGEKIYSLFWWIESKFFIKKSWKSATAQKIALQ